MNKVILMGRLTRDPEVRYTQGNEPMAIARYTLAVDRRGRKDGGEATADFIQCVAFRNNAEFAEKYLRQGTKIAITGRIQTGSYTDREGRKVYTTEVVVEEAEFAESKNKNSNQQEPPTGPASGDGFMNIPEGADDQLPFNWFSPYRSTGGRPPDDRQTTKTERRTKKKDDQKRKEETPWHG